MADAHYEVDEALKPARDLIDPLRKIAQGWDGLTRARGVLIQRRDGDGSQASHYAGITAAYGYASDAEAKASFEEIDAAITQMLNRHL
jgi:hypothetical protein